MQLLDKKQKKDNWGWLSAATPHTIHYEDGTSRPLTTDQVVMTFGKYKDSLVSEVNDRGYLQWLVREGDVWQEIVASLRLKEMD